MFQHLKKSLLKENSVKGASVILIVTLALSNILGVLRDHFLASKIPTDKLDIYFAAFRFPDLIFNVLILGSIAAAFVPVYSGYLKKNGQEEATKLAQATLTIGVCAITVALIFLYILMPYLMHLLVPNFEPQKMDQTVHLARWLLLSPFFFTISYFLGGLLNSHKRFLVYSIAPLFYNFSIIIAVYLFADKFSVNAAVIGVIIGAFLHMLVQMPSAIKLGFRFKFLFDLKSEGVKRILKLMIPRAIGLGANQILLVAFTSFASAFSGGIAIYNFADNIQTVPSVIFGNSFALAVFPTLAGFGIANIEDKKQFERFFLKAVKAILFFLIPSTALLILLRAQIIRIILGYGFFGWSDTRTAAATLGFFALGIIAQGLIPVLARGFYAMHNTRTPMYSSIASIVLSVVTGYILTRFAADATGGVSVLALAFSVGSWLNLLLLVYFLNKKIDFDWPTLTLFLVKVIILTVVMSVFVQFLKGIVADSFDIDRVRYLALQIISSLVLGGGVYLLLAYFWRFDEIS